MKNLPTRILVAGLAVAGVHVEAAETVRLADLADLSLEQLTRVTVTSASRREERAIDAAASIFVITAEDIRRAGANTLPEALRLAPNLQVVRGDTSQYIISARGGLAGTANKMLVLIDKRTVYTPLFSGVFWDAQNAIIEDVERIEVISGPGSTLWGTNAVNGVVNIITKPAGRTRGTLVSAVGGDAEKGLTARQGFPGQGGGDLRIYGKYFDRLQNRLQSGASARDQSDRWLAGFRGDGAADGHSSTLQGEVYKASVDNLGGARSLAGGHILGRWTGGPRADEQWSTLAYYDRTEREHAGSFREKRDTVELDAQRAMRPSDRQRVVVGASQRFSRDRTDPTAALGFVPDSRTLSFTSLFAQDEMHLAPGLEGTLGLRAERNTYTGVEWLPNARLSYALAPDHVVWTALTRAVRSPSRIDRDVVVPGFPPFVLNANGDFQSEVSNVAELGYRAALGPAVSVSFTAFHHELRKLRTLEPAAGGGFMFANAGKGRLSGLEGWGDWAVHRDWRLVWGFAAMTGRTSLYAGRVNLTENPLGNNPKRTAQLRSLWNVSGSHELDVAVRYMGSLPQPFVPSYTTTDIRWGWHVARGFEISVLAANVFDRRHIEFTTPEQAAYLGRSLFLKATWTP